jgi:GMP synthase PP-ATPase subunit
LLSGYDGGAWVGVRQIRNPVVLLGAGLNRVVLDVTSKPPGTIEGE